MVRVAYLGPAQTWEEAIQRLLDYKGFIACDTETVSVEDKRPIGIGFATGPNEAFYFPAFQDDPNSQHTESPELMTAIGILEDPRVKVWFNATFDLEVLEIFLNPDKMNWQDVSIACRVQAMQNSLEGNAGEYMGEVHQTIAEILPRTKSGKVSGNMLSVSMEKAAFKCMNDCLSTWRLCDMVGGPRWWEGSPQGFTWTDKLRRTHTVTQEMIKAYRLDRRLIPLLRKMGDKGLDLDTDFLRRQYTKLAAEKFHYLDICQQQFGFNPGSNQQVGYVLASRGNYLPWTKKGQYKQYAVGTDELLTLSDPLVHIILEYRKRADKLSDVIEPLLGKPLGPEGKKVPYQDWVPMPKFTTHFRLDLATSRLASSRRNIQNITPELREMFIGPFTYWDANQIEYRIFGHLSQEPNILNAYRDGLNVHEITMGAIWPGQVRYPQGKTGIENPLYTDAKVGNYAVIYKVMEKTLAKQMRRSVDFCRVFINGWRELNPTGVKWQQWAIEDGRQHGYVPTLEGRLCRLPDLMEPGGSEEHTDTCAVNYRVQGTAAWPIKEALLKWDEEGYDQRVQLHDEDVLVGTDWEFPPDYALEFGGIKVPVEVKRGVYWR